MQELTAQLTMEAEFVAGALANTDLDLKEECQCIPFHVDRTWALLYMSSETRSRAQHGVSSKLYIRLSSPRVLR